MFLECYCQPCIRELTALDILSEDYPNIRFAALTPDSSGEVRKLIKILTLKWGKRIVVPGYDGEFDDILHVYVYSSKE